MRRAFGNTFAVLWAVCAAVVAVGLIPAYGFDPPLLSHGALRLAQYAAILLFLVERLWCLVPFTRAGAHLRARWPDYAIIAAAAAITAADFAAYHEPVRIGLTVYVMVAAATMLVRYGARLRSDRIEPDDRGGARPTRLIAGGFAIMILVGGFLLALPTVSRPILAGETPYQWRDHALNCLFTSTSAACVTGLTVYRTGHDFTLGGQVIILVLIQAGGLAIMTAGTLLAASLSRRIGPHGTPAGMDAPDGNTRAPAARTIRLVLISALAIEGIGAVALYPMWNEADVGAGGRWFWSVFHAVSAFCNAGFTLSEGNLIPYRRCWQVYGVIMPLIVIGGLGFPVLRELSHHAAWRVTSWIRRSRPSRRRDVRPVSDSPPYSLHAKLVLTTTLALIAGGASLLWLLETPSRWSKRHTVRMDRYVLVADVPDRMCSMQAGERAWAALFLSVTSRTAGFSTVLTDEQSLAPATHLLLCLLMVVGGSPASTAGGIKTVTFAVLVLGVCAALRGRTATVAFGRTIPRSVTRVALVVGTMMLAMVFLVTWLLCYFEPHSFLALLMETASASGTAGLSAGITPNLTKPGRVLIILCMFAGRIGPLAMLLTLAGRREQAGPKHPEESPIVG